MIVFFDPSLKTIVSFSAIELTQRHPQYLEVVVGYRQKYLKDYGGGKKETNQKYLQAMKNVCD